MNAEIAYFYVATMTGLWTSATFVGCVYSVLNTRHAMRQARILREADLNGDAGQAANDIIGINRFIACGHFLGFLPAVAGFGLRRTSSLENYSLWSATVLACIVGLMLTFSVLAWYLRRADLRMLRRVRMRHNHLNDPLEETRAASE